jgi:adenylate cyclase class IV
MIKADISFEVEIRYRFKDSEEAYLILPFLKSSFDREITWVTKHYGLVLFKAGQVVRMSEVIRANELRNYLGWKGPDIGSFANIREEIDEEITGGIKDSAVLKLLGGNSDISSPKNAEDELERLGHHDFMSFHGINSLGYDKSTGLATKLMNCPDLKWPCMVELEKTAHTEQEARQCEGELMEISRKLKLADRLLKEEPPTLLYTRLYNKAQ